MAAILSILQHWLLPLFFYYFVFQIQNAALCIHAATTGGLVYSALSAVGFILYRSGIRFYYPLQVILAVSGNYWQQFFELLFFSTGNIEGQILGGLLILAFLVLFVQENQFTSALKMIYLTAVRCYTFSIFS